MLRCTYALVLIVGLLPLINTYYQLDFDIAANESCDSKLLVSFVLKITSFAMDWLFH